MAALAVGARFGVPIADAAAAAIAAYVPANNRSQMTRTERNTLIIDAYNANPSSMRAALDNFAAVQAPEKVALLGDMRELGAESLEEHCAIVRQALASGIRTLFVGEEFARALKAVAPDPMPLCFPDSEALLDYLQAHPVSGAVVLVKGSRGIRMETVLPAL